ncbi:hypothetical protein FLONG3_6537 [Fusarium longipes]|uniref:Heterokaryon incompatibility domain-containing protein n=1 Tax=Fusarium longipes TaxID=694270 RepID=A0A395SLC5_9HYPO|nr:hypothetical protein FLONG3_6537 [Fusarium longipes]
MSSDFTYRPLLENEIRLLKIENVDVNGTTTSNECHPIICSLEHVPLPQGSNNVTSKRFKGYERTWPELATPDNFAPLFNNGEVPNVKFIRPSNSEETIVEEETVLPWRHKWGDYIALSYVWGHPKRADEEDRYFVTIDGSPFQVTPNLYHALEQLRKSHRVRQGFKLWIDAICIDQADADERGHQVARMGDIYRSAWQVAIWLGPSNQDSELAFSALHWLSQESKRPKPMANFYRESPSIDMRPLFIMWPRYSSPMRKEVYKALFHFFTRPYWRRMWIVQEVAMGNPNSPILCGDQCISWQDLYQAVQVISSDESRLGREILDSVQPQMLLTWSFEVARDRQLRGRTYAPEHMWKIQEKMMRIQQDQKPTSSASGWKELARALTLARDAFITDDKDRVYGVLGIRAVADRVKIKPDYNLSQSSIYSKFASELMSAGDLNILRLASGHEGYVIGNWEMEHLPPSVKNRVTGVFALPILNTVAKSQESIPVGVVCDHYIPSWSVCWACAPSPKAQLGGVYKADAQLSLSIPTFSRGQATLTTKGVLLDRITSLSASHEYDADTRYPVNTTSSISSIYGDLEATRNAFWRTIVGDTTIRGDEKAPESYAWLLQPRLWQRGIAGVWTNGFGLHNFMGRNSSLEICGFTVQELIFGRKNFKSTLKRALGDNFYNATELQQEAFSWAVNAMAWRRFFGTEKGRMGMGTCAAEIGDSIVLLSGCNTPLIMRQSGNGWKLVGECYVHGVMYGETSLEQHDVVDVTIY